MSGEHPPRGYLASAKQALDTARNTLEDGDMEGDYDVGDWPDRVLAERMLDGAEKFVARIERELSRQP